MTHDVFFGISRKSSIGAALVSSGENGNCARPKTNTAGELEEPPGATPKMIRL